MGAVAPILCIDLPLVKALSAHANPNMVNFRASEIPSSDGADVAILLSSVLEVIYKPKNVVGQPEMEMEMTMVGNANTQISKVQTVTLDEVAKPCTSSVEMVDKVDDIVENRVTRKRKSCLSSSKSGGKRKEEKYGTLSRYKARLVANGSTQLSGIDVDETISPVVKPGIFVARDSSRMFLSQRKYATEILERAQMVTCNPSRTPVDTESKLELMCNSSASTKHIEIVRDLVAARQVRVLHVPSRYQYADIFTKGLPSALFEEFRSSLSVWCPLAQTAGEC
ncbi:ribonuclease H-like domain-containing protein [Tanacetum coccineum]